jgi:hypothetical protein
MIFLSESGFAGFKEKEDFLTLIVYYKNPPNNSSQHAHTASPTGWQFDDDLLFFFYSLTTLRTYNFPPTLCRRSKYIPLGKLPTLSSSPASTGWEMITLPCTSNNWALPLWDNRKVLVNGLG